MMKFSFLQKKHLGSLGLWIFIILCFYAEFSMLNHRYKVTQETSSIILFLGSLFLGIIPLFFHKYLFIPQVNLPKKNIWLVITLLISSIFAYKLYVYFGLVISKYPIHYMYSDIIPTIQQQVDRFIHGQKVYQPIIFENYSYPSGYLPATWMPFTIAALLKIDFRWIPVIFFFIALLIILISYRKKINQPLTILGFILIPFTLYHFIHYNSDVAGFSVEILVAAYYLLLVMFMDSKRYLFIGFFIALCLLSRYTLALWLPLYLFTFLIDKNKQGIIKVLASTFCVLLLLYILPFFISDPSVLFNGLLSYGNSGIAEWTHIDDNNPYPVHLYKGIGFAYFYYKIPHLEIIKKIQLMQVSLFSLLLIFNGIMAFIYWKFKQQMNRNLFLICSFKIYLTLFFTFIHVPYIYLYTVPMIISAGMIFYFATLTSQVENTAN